MATAVVCFQSFVTYTSCQCMQYIEMQLSFTVIWINLFKLLVYQITCFILCLKRSFLIILCVHQLFNLKQKLLRLKWINYYVTVIFLIFEQQLNIHHTMLQLQGALRYNQIKYVKTSINVTNQVVYPSYLDFCLLLRHEIQQNADVFLTLQALQRKSSNVSLDCAGIGDLICLLMAYPSIIISHYDIVSITVKNLLFDYDYVAPVVYENLAPIFPQSIEQASNYLKILMGLARSSLNVSAHLFQVWKFLDQQQLIKNTGNESLQLTRKHIIKQLRSKVIEIISELQFNCDCSKLLLSKKCSSKFAENAFIQMRRFDPDFFRYFLTTTNTFVSENQLKILKQVLIDCVENNTQFFFGAEVMEIKIVKRTPFINKTILVWIQWLLVQMGATLNEEQIRGLNETKEEMKELMLEEYVQMIEDITQ
ncbi:Hypothetical_protein [Hexamita inflata]|uniref:Hypothetical_protein n=1 Tax=Hexamita inflata TaxID=28002 RepID=A0AA86NEX5_9EUKA|nr:Hypothetical protein HINF_LOCUS5935 [Hexamita inflata]